MNRRKFFSLLAGLTAVPAVIKRLGLDSRPTPFAGKWSFTEDELLSTGEFANRGKFEAWFKYYTRPLHMEFAQVYFHKRTHETQE